MSNFFLLFNILIFLLVIILQTVILIWGKKYTQNNLQKIKNFKNWEIIKEHFRKKYFKILINFFILYSVELISLFLLIKEYLSKH